MSKTTLHRHRLPPRPTAAAILARRAAVAQYLDHAQRRHQETDRDIWRRMAEEYQRRLSDLDRRLEKFNQIQQDSAPTQSVSTPLAVVQTFAHRSLIETG